MLHLMVDSENRTRGLVLSDWHERGWTKSLALDCRYGLGSLGLTGTAADRFLYFTDLFVHIELGVLFGLCGRNLAYLGEH